MHDHDDDTKKLNPDVRIAVPEGRREHDAEFYDGEQDNDEAPVTMLPKRMSLLVGSSAPSAAAAAGLGSTPPLDKDDGLKVRYVADSHTVPVDACDCLLPCLGMVVFACRTRRMRRTRMRMRVKQKAVQRTTTTGLMTASR